MTREQRLERKYQQRLEREREYVRDWRRRNQKHIKTYRAKNWKKRAQQAKEWRRRTGKKYNTTASVKRWHAKNPLAQKAQQALNRAVNRGEIKKPKRCQKCGRPGRINGHHRNYRKPFLVIWLCQQCHRDVHAKQSCRR